MMGIDSIHQSAEKVALLKSTLELSHLYFWRYFFKNQTGIKTIVNDHHQVISDTLDRVFNGEITRLIINIPPGYTKTELAVISFVAHGLALNPKAKFIHTSYSAGLALENSTKARDIVRSPEYQQLWPMALRDDKDAKGSWFNEDGGGMYSASAGGQLTGFRAGYADDGFTGAFIIDDPIKPDDAFSEKIRGDINRRFTNTFKSRLMCESVPIILIMQRIHQDDPTGFLLQGGTGEKWHYLKIPVSIDDDSLSVNKSFTHAIPIEHGLPDGPLWEYKHNQQQIETLKADVYTYAAQYQQEPDTMETGMVKREWFGFYDQIPSTISLFTMFADTAMKKGEHNDYSVFGLFGTAMVGNTRKLYVLHIERGKWDAHELREKAAELWLRFQKYNHRAGLTTLKIEDKASGTGLIQDCSRGITYQGKVIEIQATEIQRTTDKVSRTNASIPQIAGGNVLLPSQATPLTGALWAESFIDELSSFNAQGTHKHDDQVDVLNDAVSDLLLKETPLWVM
ncbi:MAG: phage terminase large subunit [Gammaproteobacteria bacterium]|nr:phage terminase large subunit [Gammaproteobacteria bacterium]